MQRLTICNGFFVGFELSSNNTALKQLIDAMAPDGRIAGLALSSGRIIFDKSRTVCKSLVIKGVCGREMIETWRKMPNLFGGASTSAASSRNGCRPNDTKKVQCDAEQHRGHRCTALARLTMKPNSL